MPPKVTVLQLQTSFPRIPGDVASPETYLGELEVISIANATVRNIVSQTPDRIDIKPFEDALEKATGDIIVTSCGFLAYWQKHLALRTNKPFISSALVALKELSLRFSPSEILILTFDKESLGHAHFGEYTAYHGGTIGLRADMYLRRVISEDQRDLDVAKATHDVTSILTGAKLSAYRHILLECTNLPPYKPTITRMTGLGVSDILTCIEGMKPGSVRPEFLI